jgi:anti-anti-sigma factor
VPDPGFKIDVADGGDVIILRIIDHIERHELYKVEEAINALNASGHSRFVVDLSAATNITSTGMGLMLYYQHMLQNRGGGLAIASPSAEVMRQLEHAGLEEVFIIYSGIDEAIDALRRGRSSRKQAPAGA